MNQRQKEFIEFENKMDKLSPGYKKKTREWFKKIGEDTMGMSMIEYFKYIENGFITRPKANN